MYLRLHMSDYAEDDAKTTTKVVLQLCDRLPFALNEIERGGIKSTIVSVATQPALHGHTTT